MDELDGPVEVTGARKDRVSPPSRPRSGSGRRLKLKIRITKQTIDEACDVFFRSRGMQVTDSFNSWRRFRFTERFDE